MRRIVLAGVLALAAATFLAVPAMAADLTGGCLLEARSFDDADVAVDEGRAPGPAGTLEDPFEVDYYGYIDFLFRTPAVFSNNHWNVRVYGVSVLAGRDDNPGDTDETGIVEIDGLSPLRVVGLFHVQGDIFGNADTAHCHGDGWVYLIGDPVGTLPWIIALVLLGLGLVLLVATPYSLTWETDATGGETLHSGPVGPGGGSKPLGGGPPP